VEWGKPRSYNVVDGSFKYLGREEQEDLECKVTTPPPLASWANSLFFLMILTCGYDSGLDQPKFGGSLQFGGVLFHRVSPLHINFDLKGVLVEY
jgi:hypothetical protein